MVSSSGQAKVEWRATSSLLLVASDSKQALELLTVRPSSYSAWCHASRTTQTPAGCKWLALQTPFPAPRHQPLPRPTCPRRTLLHRTPIRHTPPHRTPPPLHVQTFLSNVSLSAASSLPAFGGRRPYWDAAFGGAAGNIVSKETGFRERSVVHWLESFKYEEVWMRWSLSLYLLLNLSKKWEGIQAVYIHKWGLISQPSEMKSIQAFEEQKWGLIS